MSVVKLTVAQALVRYMQNQYVLDNGVETPLFAGCWAIFGHGNVAGLGQALYEVKAEFPTYRGHNEQGMAHAAIAYSKAKRRKQVVACTSSIGPGATNMVTAAALAYVNRLPVLFLPGDTFESGDPDPVLQQIENFESSQVTANDTFKPVSRYWQRIDAPEKLLTALPEAVKTLLCPVNCGPVTLALPQDVQTHAFDWPSEFFDKTVHEFSRVEPDNAEFDKLINALQKAEKPLMVVGGGVLYADAEAELAELSQMSGIPVCETQAGKSTLIADHPLNLGSVGVTGTSAANDIASEADLVIFLGTRIQDFTSASRTLFSNAVGNFYGINVNDFDGTKHGATSIISDAKIALSRLIEAFNANELAKVPSDWTTLATSKKADWLECSEKVMQSVNDMPSDSNVIGVVNSVSEDNAVVVCAAGGLPGELHKHWQARQVGGYHVEYGYSCMGYEIAGGLGVAMAEPMRQVIVMVGDGSYLMMNSEIATAVSMGVNLTIVVLDNRGFGCINRLQQGCGGEPFNNLLEDSYGADNNATDIDFAAHARALGADAEHVNSLDELQAGLKRASTSSSVKVLVIDTDSKISTSEGGAWWEVAVSEVSDSAKVIEAHQAYVDSKKKQY